MIESIIQVLLSGPILYSAIGYWMYSNSALLNSKEVQPISNFWDRRTTQHHVSDAFTEITPATPFLILFVIAVIAKIDHHTKFSKQFISKSNLAKTNKVLKTLNHFIEPSYYDALN